MEFNKQMASIQPAVKKETLNVTISTAIGVVIMWIAFVLLKILLPDFYSDIKLYTVFLGGLCGGAIAVLNFFFMGITVQRVASETDEKNARAIMKMSYTRRLLIQIVWIIVAICAPCFQFIAGIAPLFFPSFGIKLTGIIKAKKANAKSDLQKLDAEANNTNNTEEIQDNVENNNNTGGEA